MTVDEMSCPNGGDGNADGQLDAYDPLASWIDCQIAIEVEDPSCSSILEVYTTNEGGTAPLRLEGVPTNIQLVDDENLEFTYGLNGLVVACDQATVRYRYFTVSELRDRVFKKYAPTTLGDETTAKYFDYPATFGSERVGDQDVATIELTLTDGAIGDRDSANGIINDPAGPTPGGSGSYYCRGDGRTCEPCSRLGPSSPECGGVQHCSGRCTGDGDTPCSADIDCANQ